MVVHLRDSFGHSYELVNPKLIQSALHGLCLSGPYRPLEEFIEYEEGAFRLDRCEAWEVV